MTNVMLLLLLLLVLLPVVLLLLLLLLLVVGHPRWCWQWLWQQHMPRDSTAGRQPPPHTLKPQLPRRRDHCFACCWLIIHC